MIFYMDFQGLQLVLAWQWALSAGVCSKLPSLAPTLIAGVESSP